MSYTRYVVFYPPGIDGYITDDKAKLLCMIDGTIRAIYDTYLASLFMTIVFTLGFVISHHDIFKYATFRITSQKSRTVFYATYIHNESVMHCEIDPLIPSSFLAVSSLVGPIRKGPKREREIFSTLILSFIQRFYIREYFLHLQVC